jgi:putative membrane protein
MNMKKLTFLAGAVILIAACNNDSPSVQDADSVNNANRDSATSRGTYAADRESSEFLVRAAESSHMETELAKWEQQEGTIAEIRQFASMLQQDHTALGNEVKQLAQTRSITLPDSLGQVLQDDLSSLQRKKGKDIDKNFIKLMIRRHENSIDLFQNAVNKANDTEVRQFADNTLPKLRQHLDSARSLEKKYW